MPDLFESKYLIHFADNPRHAVRLAFGEKPKDFSGSEANAIKKYLSNEVLLPINVLKKSCRINKIDANIPIQFQHIWICLNKCKIERQLSEIKKVTPIVAFHSVYVEPRKNLTELVETAVKLVGTTGKLALLCNVKKRQTVSQWRTGKTKPQLIALLKICELLEKYVWQEIDGCRLYGNGSPEEESMIFHNYHRSKLTEIIVWLKLEGHLDISAPRGETNQKSEAKITLIKIKEKIQKLYSLNPKQALIYDNSTQKGTQKDWTGFKLTISSAPLRQILALRYNMDIGYKCPEIEISEDVECSLDKEQKKQIFCTVLETEGSFLVDKKYGLPRICVSTISEKFIDQAIGLANELGYRTQKVKSTKGKNKMFFEFRINHLNDTVKCFYDILPYFVHPTKKATFLKILENPELLHKLRLSNQNSLVELIKNARLIISKSKTGINKKLANEIQTINRGKFTYKRSSVNGWIRGKAIPLQAITRCCQITGDDYFKHVPNNMSVILMKNNIISEDEFWKVRKSEQSGLQNNRIEMRA